MPISSKRVMSVEDICTELGYNTKEKPKRQYDLTLATKAWRASYVTSDGIPGRELTEWGSDKGNAEIKVMSQKFLEKHGVKHWPPENGGLELGRDQEKLLQLLHQLFWRQNSAAKSNQILKEKRLKQEAQSLIAEISLDYSSDNYEVGFAAMNPRSGTQSPDNADAHSYPRGGATRLSYLSKKRRRRPIAKGAYCDLSTDEEESDHRSRPSLKIFRRKLLLNLAQYRDDNPAFSATGSAPIADMGRKAAAPVVPESTTRQEPMSTSEATHIMTYPPQCAVEKSDTDSEPIIHRRVMTRERNISGLARRYREDDGVDRMRRISPSRTWIGTIIGAVEAKDDGPSSMPQSPPRGNILASRSPINFTVNESGGGGNGDHAPSDDGTTRGRSSTRKRTRSQVSIEAPMSAKRLPPKSSVREQNWPLTPARSADSDAELSIQEIMKEAGKGTYEGREEPSAHEPPRRALSRLRACRRCQRVRIKCDVEKPCRNCRAGDHDCTLAEPVGLKPTPTASPPSPLIEDALRYSPTNAPKTGNRKTQNGNLPHATGKEQKPVTADPNISTGHKSYTDSAPNDPSRNKSNQDTDTPVPQSVRSTNTTPATQPSLPKPAPKSKNVTYYILASDSLTSYEEPWSGPSLSEMTLETLFAHAATHTSGREVLKVRFTLSSPQPGFVGRRNTVEREDAGSLEEVIERFRFGRKEGLKKGISKFNILLEPEVGAQPVNEEIEDVDDI